MSSELGFSYRVSVVFQTHWDREWYFPQQTFAQRLLAVMHQVCDALDAGELTSFVFDGQVAAMEDLLAEAEPELAERVLAHARAGRVVLGPWYVMADEFLVSGESLWRNLEMGINLAESYGNCQRVGYLPDSFGHVGQMPQILRRMGIGRAVVWRGLDLRHAEFRWQAPDGSVVDALYLTQGYYQHPLNLPAAGPAMWKYLDIAAPRSRSRCLLLTQGGDHLAPRMDAAARLRQLEASQERYQFVQESLEAHLDAIGSFHGARIMVGELRQNAQSFLLPDVLSTRRYLKENHQLLEDRLLGETEPLWAWLRNVPTPYRAILESWKRLILNQAHDSICGCSADVVHEEMQSRFQQLEQRLDALRERAIQAAGLQSASQHFGVGASVFADHQDFTLFNPLPLVANNSVQVSLLLQGARPQAIRVLDDSACPVPIQWVGYESADVLRSPLDDFPERIVGHRLSVRLTLPMAGLQAHALRLKACEPHEPGASVLALATEQQLPWQWQSTHGVLTVDRYGRLVWSTNGRRLRIVLQTEMDAGDSYNYSPPSDADRQLHEAFQLVSVQLAGDATCLRLRSHFEQPASLNPARTGPSEERVASSLELELLLQPGNPWIEVRLRHRTDAKDHRTRLIFALDETWAETAADSAFHWTRRPVVLAQYPKQAEAQVEMPLAVNPSLTAIQAGSLAVIHRGLQEFEVLEMSDGGHGLGLTLQRAVGWLSRRDLVTRGAGAGPDVPTPGAQKGFDGETSLAFALDATLTADSILCAGLRLRRPPLVLIGHGREAWREPFTLPDPRLIPSSVRTLPSGELELRVWNALEQPVTGYLPGWQRQPAEEQVRGQVGPHEIATYVRAAS